MNTIKKAVIGGLVAIAAATASAQQPLPNERIYTGRVLHVEESLWQGVASSVSYNQSFFAAIGSYVAQLENGACAQYYRSSLSQDAENPTLKAVVQLHQTDVGVLKLAQKTGAIVTIEGLARDGERCMTFMKAYFGAPQKTPAEDPAQQAPKER